MLGFCPAEFGSNALMLKLVPLIAAGLVVAGVAAAEDRAAAAPEGTERFWVQERPLSPRVSTDVLAQDRRFAGALGYGVTLAPPPAPRGPLALDTARSPSGLLSIDNFHFGVDLLPTGGTFGRGSIAQFAMTYGGQVSDDLTLGVGPTLSVGGDGTASLFGSATPATGGLLRRLQSDAGVRDYGLRGSAVYSLTDNWALTGVLGYRRALGELGAASSDEQFFSVLGLGYRF